MARTEYITGNPLITEWSAKFLAEKCPGASSPTLYQDGDVMKVGFTLNDNVYWVAFDVKDCPIIPDIEWLGGVWVKLYEMAHGK